MTLSSSARTLLISAGCLCGGVALGTLLPAGSSPGNAKDSAKRGGSVQTPAGPGGKGAVHLTQTDEASTPTKGLPSAGGETDLGKLPAAKLLALFEKLSNLKSDSRKYVLAYRLASQMDASQVEEALKSALQDLTDGDYVTTRAIARRWVELDPQAALQKATESKQQHLLLPMLESWSRMDPEAPLNWALKQDPSARAEAVLPLLRGRMLDQSQLEKVVMNAGISENEDMRNQVFPFATSRLAESNPQGALHAAASVEDPALRQRTLIAVLSRLGQSAPDVAKSWLETQQTFTSEEKTQLEAALNSQSERDRGGDRGRDRFRGSGEGSRFPQ